MRRNRLFTRIVIWAATSVMALMCLAFAPMGKEAGTISIDGRTFASSQNEKGETWQYEAKTHTLTLSGYDGMYIDFSALEDAVIEVTGTNKVTSNLNFPAILVNGPLTITGEGSLELVVSACHTAVYAQNGDLSIENTKIILQASGETADAGYLLMADGSVNITGANIRGADEVKSPGGVVGARAGDVIVDAGTEISVFSASKLISAPEGSVTIRGEGTSAELWASDSAIYGKNNITIEGPAYVHAESKDADNTAIFCPEGSILIRSAEVDIVSSGAAMAGKKIELTDAYVSDPLEAKSREVSSMMTMTTDEGVLSEVHIAKGIAPTPTPTPTPSPTPTPLPTPTPVPPETEGFVLTTRMIIGGVLVIVALVAVAVILIGKIRGRE